MSPKAVYLCFKHEFYPGSIGDWFHCIIQGWAESVRCSTLFENGSDAKQFFYKLEVLFHYLYRFGPIPRNIHYDVVFQLQLCL